MPLIWRAVLSLFYPPVIIRGKNGKNSESPVGSNKSEKRKPKSAVYRSFWASVVYFHLRLISTRRHEWEMTRNQFGSNPTRVRIPPSPPEKSRVNPVFTRFFHIYGQNGWCDKHRPFCYFRANVIMIFFDNTTLARPPPRSKKAWQNPELL